MLGLGTGFHGVGGNTYNSGEWLPTDEGGKLVAWYRFNTGITDNEPGVSLWQDGSGNGHHMVQSTSADQPSHSSGIITFDSNDDLQLDSTSITLEGGSPNSFTIGIRSNTSDPTRALLADNLDTNSLIKHVDSNTLRFKTASGTANIDLDGGNSFGDDYIVLTRSSANALKLWFNGVEQAATVTKAGSYIINSIGTRYDHTNSFVGDMYEIIIFSSLSDELTANVNNRLAGLS